MSESLFHHNVLAEQREMYEAVRLLARPVQLQRRNLQYHDFQHHVWVANEAIYAGVGGTIVNAFNIPVPAQSAIVLTSLELRAAPDSQDPMLTGDWRATDDTAPYRGAVGYNGPGTLQYFDGPTTAKFPPIEDFGLLSQGTLFVFQISLHVIATINPVGIGSKDMFVTGRLNTYIVPSWVGALLKTIETRIDSADQTVPV